jgi:hypothetical protein
MLERLSGLRTLFGHQDINQNSGKQITHPNY